MISLEEERQERYTSFLQSVYPINLNSPIYDDCWNVEVIKVCIEVYFDKIKIKIFLVGIKLADTEIGWNRDGNILRAEFESITLNTGIYKLEKPKLKFEHDLDTNNGNCNFTSKLYKYVGIPPFGDFELKKEWNEQVIFTW